MEIGKKYPIAVQCVIHEANFLGERRLKETKIFKLVEVEWPRMKNLWEIIRDYDSLIYYGIGLIVGYMIHYLCF